jgi:5-methyltetrahydrofolate--homocysteine methyltransferase
MVAMLEGMGADAIGVNCSLGPKALFGVVEEYLKYASVPVLLKPNAGLPKIVDGKSVYDVLPNDFAKDVSELVRRGVRLVGGCCGTTPEYILATAKETENIAPVVITPKSFTCASSRTHSVIFDGDPLLIGNKINPKNLEQVILEEDIDSIVDEAMEQQDDGADMLSVNVGLDGIDEVKMLTDAVCEIQMMIDLPIQIITSNIVAMESALRRYNGKAMINSVNGTEECMKTVFPLVKKYGGLIVARTIDNNGLPETAEERYAIAERVVLEAQKYGIDKKNIIFDTSSPTISAVNSPDAEALRAAELIENILGCHTVLGSYDALL